MPLYLIMTNQAFIRYTFKGHYILTKFTQKFCLIFDYEFLLCYLEAGLVVFVHININFESEYSYDISALPLRVIPIKNSNLKSNL